MTIKVTSSTDNQANQSLGELADKSAEAANESASDASASDETAEESDASEESSVSDGEENENESDQKDGDGKKPKKRSGIQKRINKLNRRLTESERRAEYWENEAKRNRDSRQETKPDAGKADASVSGKPSKDDFESHDAYVEALVDWKADQKLKENESKKQESESRLREQTRATTHFERVQSFKESHDDFDEVLSEIDDIPYSVAVKEVILESKNGPELMYELAKHREEYERICKLPAMQAALELGRFEAKYLTPKETGKVTKKTTEAPPPLKTVGSGQGKPSRKSIFDKDLSQAEYEELRAEQMKRKRA